MSGPSNSGWTRRAGVVLLGIAVVILGVPVLAIIRGGVTLTGAQWVVYVAGPAIGASVLAAVSHWRPDLRTNLLLGLVTTGAALFVADLGLSVVTPTDAGAVHPPRDGTPPGWDGRSPQTIVRDLRAAGEVVYPRISAPLAQGIRIDVGNGRSVQPLSPSPSNVRVVFCNEIGSPVIYDSDEHGFNNPPGVWSAPVMDAVLIGDSFTHGACVARTDHFSQRLREVMPRVLNLGVSGSGPLTELAILREYAAEKTPRHVFWVYYEGNDRYDVSVENRHPVLSRYRDDPAFRQHLLQYQDGIDAGLAAWVDSALSDPPQPQAISLSQRIRLSMALSTLRQVAGIAVPMPSREPAALNIPTILATAVSEVRAWGGTFHLVYLPQYARYQSRIGSGTRGRNDVLSTADSLGVDVIDLVPVFDRLTDPQSMWTGPGGHYAVAGYRLVGEAVLGAIHHP